ncbi:MAG: hypothetical protein KAH25_01770, partial [Bacteroidales bacterium]|nr:hypothetical protein [Bacteroidales bacterium]
ETIYNEHLSYIDFSAKVNMETGELIKGELQQDTHFMAYEISEKGILEKHFGNTTSDWNDIEEFSQDVIPAAENNGLPTRTPAENIAAIEGASQQGQINQNESNISELTIDTKTQSLSVPVLAVPLLVSQSDNIIIKSALLSVQELQNETENYANKRNQINTYYQATNKKARELEQESQQLLNKANVTEADILEAKQKNTEGELLFVKASESAKIIAEYDDELLKQTKLIQSSISELNQIEVLLSEDNSEQAQYKSQQLQDNISSTEPSSVDDSNFDYMAGVFIDEPLKTAGNIRDGNEVVDNQLNSNTVADVVETGDTVEVDGTVAVVETGGTVEVDGTVDTVDTVEAVAAVIFVDLQSYLEVDLEDEQAIQEALSEINTYSQNQISKIVSLQDALVLKAEEKLELSNKMSIEAEKATDNTDKIEKQKLTKQYLYEALAIKRLSEDFEVYADKEMLKRMQISKHAFEIQEALKQNDLEESKDLFNEMVKDVDHFGEEPKLVLSNLNKQILKQNESLSLQIDSAYAMSQNLANESVKLLSEAAEERKKAVGKRNAFKRSKLLTKVESKEMKATEIQQQSELALAHGNDLYFQKQLNTHASFLNTEILGLLNTSDSALPIIAANQEIVFENIENRKQEVLYGQLNTSTEAPLLAEGINEKTKTDQDISPAKETESSIQSYEREVFKAQMITEELELIKREIALLLTTNKSELSDREIYVLESHIKNLRQSSDSIEYQANKAYVYAN